MDQQLIAQKLESLRHCLQRVETKIPATLAELLADPDKQDVIVLNLTRAVQLCVDIASHLLADTQATAPSTMGEAFTLAAELQMIQADTAANLRRAVGFRNIAVHDYEDIDWAITYAICTQHLDDFRAFAQQVARYSSLA